MARYEDLTEFLSGLGEKDLSIRRAVLVKFGTVLLAKPKSDTFDPPSGVAPLIHNALKDHPNIFEPKQLLDEDEGVSGTKFGFFVKGPYFHYRVHLPKAKQKYQDMDSAEHFSVVSNGSMFAAYVDVQDIPIFSNIGHEFRELAKGQIEKETRLECRPIGPCPIHPDIVLVVRNQAEGDAETAPVKRYQKDDDILIVVTSNRPTVDLVLDCFFDFGFSVERFYDLALSRSDLLDASEDVDGSFTEASEKIEELLNTPSWKPWKTHLVSRQARINVATVHQSLVTLESQLLEYERDRGSSLEALKKDRDAALLFEYFRDMTSPDVGVPSSLASALTFFEGELQLYGNIRSLLIASLLGAVVGSLLTGLLGWLLLPAAGAR